MTMMVSQLIINIDIIIRAYSMDIIQFSTE